jgi:hypothetical protein
VIGKRYLIQEKKIKKYYLSNLLENQLLRKEQEKNMEIVIRKKVEQNQ